MIADKDAAKIAFKQWADTPRARDGSCKCGRTGSVPTASGSIVACNECVLDGEDYTPENSFIAGIRYAESQMSVASLTAPSDTAKEAIQLFKDTRRRTWGL